MEQPDDLKKIFKGTVIICAALMATLPLYAFTVEIIRASYKPFLGFVNLYNNIFTIRYLFFALAVIQIIIIRLLRGFLLRKSATDDARTLMRRLYKTSILISSLCEGPAIFGLILFFLSGINRDFYILLFVSFFLMFMYFPRYNNWVNWMKGNKQSNCSPACF